MAAGKEMNPNLPKHFYETISNPPDHPIRISTLFMKRHGDSLGESVILTAGGTDWKVWMKNINGGTWLEKGWKGFVEYYSIKEEYLVAFKYLGNSRFLVTIFDESCSEIVCTEPYPQLVHVKVEPADNGTAIVGNRSTVRPALSISYSVVNGRRLRRRVSGKDLDGSCGENPSAPLQSSNLRNNPSGRVSDGSFEANPTAPLQGSNLRKKVFGRDSDGSSEANETAPLESSNLRKKVSVGRPRGGAKPAQSSGRVSVGRPRARPIKRKRFGNESETRKILALEQEFKSKYPYYVCSMKPSYVSGCYVAGISVIFLEEHFPLDEIEKGINFSLRLSGEKKKWPVVVKSCRGNGTLRGRGWKYFAQRHGLKVGEICVFELIKKEQVFDFHVFA